MAVQTLKGDCLEIVKTIPNDKADLVYLDPPFFTQKVHSLVTRDRSKTFSFKDIWASTEAYAEFLFDRLKEFHRILSPTGSIFFHCDSTAAHIARLILDEIFGQEMFRAEIIWHYRRWSNSQKTLLPSHQNIYFYSKSDDYKFNHLYQEYSTSTNVDQILQKRRRDDFGKAVYATDNDEILFSGEKKGVPLNDVWDIPLLNPKAKERVGYPTQKPILLLERIIEISTAEGDLILDPFCGSGTTLVAAELLKRNSIGIDISPEAIKITKERVETLIKTDSHLMQVGREAYRNADEEILEYLKHLDTVPVQRNKGIDAFLKVGIERGSIPVRVQRPGEALVQAANLLYKASKGKNALAMVLIATQLDSGFDENLNYPNLFVVDSTAKSINKLVKTLKTEPLLYIEKKITLQSQ